MDKIVYDNKTVLGLVQEIQQALTKQKASVVAEIRSYPPPIAGCDVQFNHLLAQRTELTRELRRFDALVTPLSSDRCTSVEVETMMHSIQQFVADSVYLDQVIGGVDSLSIRS